MHLQQLFGYVIQDIFFTSSRSSKAAETESNRNQKQQKPKRGSYELRLTPGRANTDENTIYASTGSAFGSGSGDGQQVKVVEGYRHPMYNKSEHLYDVGVLKLEKEVSTDTIDLCAADGSDNEVRSVATVRGWGLTENGSQSLVMEEVSVKIISNAECNKGYSDRITEGMLCAGEGDGKDTCNGHSGGPLIENDVLVGIVSWGGKCGVNAGVYTRISYVLDYINDVVNGGTGSSFTESVAGSTSEDNSSSTSTDTTDAPSTEPPATKTPTTEAPTTTFAKAPTAATPTAALRLKLQLRRRRSRKLRALRRLKRKARRPIRRTRMHRRPTRRSKPIRALTLHSRASPTRPERRRPPQGRLWGGCMSFESGINSILDETTGDDDGLACVREICQETLSRMDRVTAAKSIANRQERKNESTDVIGDGSEAVNWKAFSPPKSRQKTLSKPKLSRRPSLDIAPAGEMPRWKIIDGNEGPITDITVIFRGDSVPEGFTKLERSPSGQRADLNNDGRGSRGEFVPTDYEVVWRRGVPANINTGTQGEKIYLCFKRSTTSSIVDWVVMFPKKNETLPYG
ncbi:hypothetical protein PC128_g23434 [Phytophthora cactorum]|nr:hypothetical protein PC128_g23434 [Phytophthora cactorum]